MSRLRCSRVGAPRRAASLVSRLGLLLGRDLPATRVHVPEVIAIGARIEIDESSTRFEMTLEDLANSIGKCTETNARSRHADHCAKYRHEFEKTAGDHGGASAAESPYKGGHRALSSVLPEGHVVEICDALQHGHLPRERGHKIDAGSGNQAGCARQQHVILDNPLG